MEDYNKILDEIVEKKGIELIKKYLDKYNKNERTKKTYTNKYYEVAIEVYTLMYKDGYNNKQAMHKVANERLISYFTVKNHYKKFESEAKEFDYYSFCDLAELFHSNSKNNYKNILKKLAKANNITFEFAITYFLMYENFSLKKKPIINHEKFTVPNSLNHLYIAINKRYDTQ